MSGTVFTTGMPNWGGVLLVSSTLAARHISQREITRIKFRYEDTIVFC
jgi:hypothetical protein